MSIFLVYILYLECILDVDHDINNVLYIAYILLRAYIFYLINILYLAQTPYNLFFILILVHNLEVSCMKIIFHISKFFILLQFSQVPFTLIPTIIVAWLRGDLPAMWEGDSKVKSGFKSPFLTCY